MIKPALTRLRHYSTKFVGSPVRFSLESRIFHTLSIFVLVVVGFEAALNLSIGLFVSSALSAVVTAVQIVFYYLSRVKSKLNLAVILSVVEIHIITGIGYFYNAGIAGASLLLFAVALFFILSVANRKQWLLWLCLNLGVVLSLTIFEYYHPQAIRQTYSSRHDWFLDNIITYLVTVALIYMGTITIRKNYMRQKRSADEQALALELMNAEKVKLFSIISHDLRTPLASVQQYFQLVTQLDMAAEERAELEKNLLQTIGNTQELLTNLLKWAKNQMDGAVARLQPVALGEYLQDTVDLFEGIAETKDIELDVAIQQDIIINADPDMLQLVIRNLLNNAIKFTPSEGKVSLQAITEGSNCIIAISDTGVGITADRQENIFSINATPTTGTHNETGTGLGLVLCKDYTELQGGNIWLESNTGKGTTFYVSHPLAKP